MICQFATGNQINLSETFTFHLPKGEDVGHIIVGRSAIPEIVEIQSKNPDLHPAREFGGSPYI